MCRGCRGPLFREMLRSGQDAGFRVDLHYLGFGGDILILEV